MGINWHSALKLLPFGIIVGVALLIAGICCLSIKSAKITPMSKTCEKSTTYHYVNITSMEYSNCESELRPILCKNRKQQLCSCNYEITLDDIIGDVVIGYTLDTFNDTVALHQSRDDSQLAGNLSYNVSRKCSPFDYDDGMPIAPCGALANAMFTDEILNVYDDKTYDPVPAMTFGLLRHDEKKQFRNPENENLTVAFQNFTKPINWTKNIWELDTKNPDNNGFQNEAFIVWMRPDLPIRPMWRLNRTDKAYNKGLPKGSYTVNIFYDYPYSLYSGNRTLTVYREVQEIETSCKQQSDIVTYETAGYGVGVAGVVIGLCLLVASAALMIAHKVTVANAKSDGQIQPVSSSNGRPSHNPPPPPGNNAEVHSVNETGNSEAKLLTKPPVIREEEEPEKMPLKENTDGIGRSSL